LTKTQINNPDHNRQQQQPQPQPQNRFAMQVVEGMLGKVPPMNSSNRGKNEKVAAVVDKMLFNFRNIGFIHLLFPEAKIIHTV